MKFQNNHNIESVFDDLFAFDHESEEIEHNAKMIMFRFLSEIEIITTEKKITRKVLAKNIGTSPSYVTQLFRGDKLINMITLAKLQKVFNITFNIKAISDIKTEYEISMPDNIFRTERCFTGIWINFKNEPIYSDNDYNQFKKLSNNNIKPIQYVG
jgi:transcriptional regulator with XRE-family HTH domain